MNVFGYRYIEWANEAWFAAQELHFSSNRVYMVLPIWLTHYSIELLLKALLKNHSEFTKNISNTHDLIILFGFCAEILPKIKTVVSEELLVDLGKIGDKKGDIRYPEKFANGREYQNSIWSDLDPLRKFVQENMGLLPQ
jgi:hypothetical protein